MRLNGCFGKLFTLVVRTWGKQGQNRLVPKEGFDVLGDIGLIDAEKVLALFQFVLKGEKTWHSPESDKVRHTRAMRLEFIHGGDVHEGRNGGKRGILA